MDPGLDCPFCTLPSDRVVAEDDLVVVIRDEITATIPPGEL